MDYGLEKRIRDTFRWKESWDNLEIEIIFKVRSNYIFINGTQFVFFHTHNLNQFRNQAITFYSR